MIEKNEAINRFCEILKSMYSKEYMISRNVQVASMLPFATLTSSDKTEMDLVLAKKDFTPIAVFAFVDDLNNLQSEELVSHKKNVSILAKYVKVYILDVKKSYSENEIKALVEDAQSHLEMLKINSRSNIIESHEKRSATNIIIKIAFSIFICVIGYIWFANSTKIAKSNSKIGSIEADLEFAKRKDKQEDAVKAITEKIKVVNLEKCDLNPPNNGSMFIHPYTVPVTGKAYWKLTNRTETHLLVKVLKPDDKKPLVDIYIAPRKDFSFTTTPLNYIYIVKSHATWCNSYVANKMDQNFPQAIERLTSSFTNDVFVNSEIHFDGNNLVSTDTYTGLQNGK
jgi:hypothetical protein